MFFDDYREAKRIVDSCQAIAMESQAHLPSKAGVCLSFQPADNPIQVEELFYITGRPMPYRFYDGTHLWVRLTNDNMILIGGNEEENDINERTLNSKEWSDLCHKNFKDSGSNISRLASPALMTLKQKPKFWRSVLKHRHKDKDGNITTNEDKFGYWAINTHFPGWIKRPESGLGSYWERIKQVRELLKFSRKIKRKVIVTECGTGQYHYALTPADVKYGYLIHKRVFGDRLIAVLFYDSDLIKRCNGINLMKA